MSKPSILVVGSTGNTGRSVVETLVELQKSRKTLSDFSIIALTRSKEGTVAQAFTKLSGVEVVEQNWVELNADWLRKHNVKRAFIASHNQPNQFAEESTFHLNCLLAGVEYVVRISTTAVNVRPDFITYYPRNHWAIEQLLSSPEFKSLRWTSLQPNVFTQFILAPAIEFIKKYRETGKQETLKLMLDAEAPNAIVDPDDVGILAAHLLAGEDTTKYNHAKLVINGPEDISGNQVVKLVEDHIGVSVEETVFRDMSFLDSWVASTSESKQVIGSIRHAQIYGWEGKVTADKTSKEVIELVAPSRTPAQVFKTMLG